MKRILVLFVVILSLAGVRVSVAHDGEDHGVSEQVVVLHGIARSSSHMEPLAEYLEAQGYQVFNLDYPSTEQKLEELVDGVQAQLREKLDPERPVHFVGYSMGGLVVRAVLNRYNGRKTLAGLCNLPPPTRAVRLPIWCRTTGCTR